MQKAQSCEQVHIHDAAALDRTQPAAEHAMLLMLTLHMNR
jgi:hypothetical protein